LSGGDGADILVGGEGNDVLSGKEGNDVLYPGLGADTLSGGGGDDIFVYDAESGGKDLIIDFRPGHDRVDIYKPGNDIAAILASAIDTRNGVRVTLADGSSITFGGLSVAGVGNDWFTVHH
jgi:Ca2+-binding RTX toxin-like protein